jgi:transcriptional regulator with XRE-family HTH domain
MIIGPKIRQLRESKKLSQGDIEHRTGLLRCYISRVENGHTVPAIETLEKLARAMEIPLYQLFYDGDKPPKPEIALKAATHIKEDRELRPFIKLFPKMNPRKRELLLSMARSMAGKNQ